MKLNSWGGYPQFEKNVAHTFEKTQQLSEILSLPIDFIPYGNGRSYGDSALNKDQLFIKPYHYFLSFDEVSGVLHCQAGAMLSEILEIFVPQGWFLRVTPGTRFVTVGGAIASDVHGKNHHLVGTFSDHIVEFTMMLPDSSMVVCSPRKNIELFRATCGGMGLTGVILSAKIKLQAIQSSQMDQVTVKIGNLKGMCEAFEEYANYTYLVAWVDCMAKGDDLGRGLLFAGEHAERGELIFDNKVKADLPFIMPQMILNHYSVKAFNMIYYAKERAEVSRQGVSINSFFYPLDAITNWNRAYGKKGFIQYQFVLPKEVGYAGLKLMLKYISDSGKGSFLAVLKLFGKANSNYLSFPMEGYTLALDFKIEPGLFDLLSVLDSIVVEFGGRFYLAKDARVSKGVFESGYPDVGLFRNIRQRLNAVEKFNSLQSRRVGI